MKICSRCKVIKAPLDFAKDKKSKSGLFCYCKACKIELEKIRRLKLGMKPTPHRRRKGNLLECIKCKQFLHFKNFYNNKRGKFGKLSYCKSCRRKMIFNSDSRENRLGYIEQYKKDGRYRNNNISSKLRRNERLVNASDGTVTSKVILKILQKRECRYCKSHIEKNQRSIEHILPLSRGGLHSESNLDMACLVCNTRKNALTEEEFLKKAVRLKEQPV